MIQAEAHQESAARASGRNGAEPDLDPTIPAIRRLDWRFLLPDPHLRRVVYFGPGSDGLLGSLQRFDSSVEASPGLIEGGPHPAASFDVAVLQGPCHDSIRRAGLALRTGGILYWELERPQIRATVRSRWSRQRGATLLRGGHRDRSALRSHGFDAIRVYWHHPTFEECRQIIPVDESRPLAYRGAQTGTLLNRQAGHILGSLARRTGLIQRLAPSISITARKGSADGEAS